ncbi:MAG: ATPase, partial [Ilumatobacteraceae bacterium]
IIDETARSVYGARIRELRAQLDDADIVGDAETSHKLQSELDALVAELAASTGLGRRTRTFIDDRERARTAVRKAIRRSVDRIAEQAPSLGMLLRATIVTGGVCRYEPADPERVSWIVRER